MSDNQLPNAPFKTLGSHLKYLREQSNETIEEVAGSVELDQKAMSRIEAGEERPAEDILLLLITHFEMQDQEAVQLWELAGYDGDIPDRLRDDDDIHPASKSIVMLLALDMRTIYTDGIDITTSQTGMTLNFTQASGQSQAMPVARLGMSYDQAEHVLEALQTALLKAKYLRGPKALPPSSIETEPTSD